MAEQVNVCGKLYQRPTTVVRMVEQPEWIPVYQEDCRGTVLLSPQTQSSAEAKDELGKAVNVAVLHLQGMPKFGPPTGLPASVTPASTPMVLPKLPMLSAQSGSRVSVNQVRAGGHRFMCAPGQPIYHTDVYFPRGSQELSAQERKKLLGLNGQPVSYVLVDGLTEVPGPNSPMSALAQARAQVVKDALQEAVPAGVGMELGMRTGCCTKNGEPGEAGKDDLGVSVSACTGTVAEVKYTDMTKGGPSSMAK